MIAILEQSVFAPDAAMLRATAPVDMHGRNWAGEIGNAIEQDWIRIDSPGGIDEIRKTLETEWSDPVDRLRLWIMFDRDCDAVRLEYEPSRASAKLVERCEIYSMLPVLSQPDSRAAEPRRGAFHQLYRRCMENYVPPNLLSRWVNRRGNSVNHDRRGEWRRTLDNYCRMSPELRHHYHLRNGLEKDRKQGDIHRDYEPHAKSGALERGFGDSINLGDAWAWYPREHGQPIPESWIVKDGSRAELHGLAKSILEWM